MGLHRCKSGQSGLTLSRWEALADWPLIGFDMQKLMPLLVVLTVLVGAGLFVTLRGEVAPASSQGEEEQSASAQSIAPPVRPPAATFSPVFEPCAHCHQIGDGARVVVGPVLNGIVGQPPGATDYPYSDEMRSSGVIWDESTLKAFLADPQSVVPGTRMYFGGLPEDEMEAIIAFLRDPEPGSEDDTE